MTSQYWNNVLNNLPTFLKQTSALCIGAEIMTNPRSLFPLGCSVFPIARPYYTQPGMYYNYTPYQTYMPYQQTYPGYNSPYQAAPPLSTSPYIQPGRMTAPTDAGAVSSTQPTSLGENFVAAPETQFVSDSWKQLDAKPNKNHYENLQMHTKYRDFISNLGKSVTAFIDKSGIGDKDGYISKDEFRKYYISQISTNAASQTNTTQLEADADKIFDSLDLTKEGKLDWKEIATLMSFADAAGANGKYDGTIKNEDAIKGMQTLLNAGSGATAKVQQNYNNLFNMLS